MAIKNGQHNGVGYVLDTGRADGNETFPLGTLPARLSEACGGVWPAKGSSVMEFAA